LLTTPCPLRELAYVLNDWKFRAGFLMTMPLPTFATNSNTTAGGDLVKQVGLESFMADVIEGSRDRPVVVEFWSSRSGPGAKQFGAVLEKMVRSLKGAVRLAKVDSDQNQEIAVQLGVQTVPAVFAFFAGRPVDGFAGALPEAQIKSWLDRVIKATGGAKNGSGLDAALKQAADFLAENNTAMALSIYADILDQEPTHTAAHAGILRCLIAGGDMTGAKEMFKKISPEMAKDKMFDPVRAAFELASEAEKSGDIAELQARLQHVENDHQTRFELAMAHYALGQRSQAVDELLEIVRRQRSWNDDAARKQLVKFFDAFGATDPLTIASRKRLSSILFA
jgi:putative thioredoxin